MSAVLALLFPSKCAAQCPLLVAQRTCWVHYFLQWRTSNIQGQSCTHSFFFLINSTVSIFWTLLRFHVWVPSSLSSGIPPWACDPTRPGSPRTSRQASRRMPCVLWIYDFDLFRMHPTHLLVNFTPPCTDWLALSRERKWPPSHVSYSCRPLRWKARRVWFLAVCP